MHIRTIASATAIAAVLGFGTAAYAQTMIGSQTVSEGDMERVKVYCEDLQNAENQAAGATDDETEAGNTTEDDADNSTGEDAEAASEDAPDTADTEDTAAVGSIDMDLITLENCKEAGFITAP
jgi:hypothetical protein